MKKKHILLILSLIAMNNVYAAVYNVATTGSDTGTGSSSSPFASPEKGLEMAQPGDTVIVRAGTYYVGGLMMPRSGNQGEPIIFEGEEGAILDGGINATGWVEAPEIGDGVYKTIIDVPYLLKGTTYTKNRAMTMTYDDKFILHINDRNQDKIDYGFNLMKEPSTSSLWDGIVAVHGRRYKNDPYTFLRFHDYQNPDLGVVKVGNHWEFDDSGTVNIINKSHIIVRGFTIKNRAIGVNIRNGASDNIIEDNIVLGGRYGIFIGYFPEHYDDAGEEILCHRNHIKNNEITLNYIYPLKLRDLDETTRKNIWYSIKDYFGDTDHEAVAMFCSGHDNQVSGNHIYGHWGGIQDWGADSGVYGNDGQYAESFEVFSNVVHDIIDDGLEPTGGEINAEWHDNHVYDCNVNFRIKQPEFGPLYIYDNRFSGPKYDIFYFGGCDAEIYVYHNSMSSERGMSMGNSSAYIGAPNTWFVNNIYSNEFFWTNENFNWDEYMDAHFDYNWAGGYYDLQGASWPSTLPGWMGSNNIIKPGERLWGDSADPSFQLGDDSPAREAGIDLSQEWTMMGVTHPALPGMETGYFSGSAPNLGAVQDGGCTEDWSCTAWSCSACSGGQQDCIRTCTDANSCGTENDKPAESGTRWCGADLIAHWSFEDVSGSTINDNSANNNDATMQGDPQIVSGRINDAIELDGDDYFSAADSESLDFDKSQGTIMIWVKAEDPISSVWQLFAIDSDYEIELSIQPDGDLFYYPWFDSGPNQNYNLVTNPTTANEWKHIAVTWDYSTKEAKIYVNSQEMTLAVENVPANWDTIAQTGDWHIGGSPVKSEYFIGEIDEVKIFSRPLTQSEIDRHYDCNPADSDCSGCIEMGELMPYIELWKQNQVTIGELMDAIAVWKGCS